MWLRKNLTLKHCSLIKMQKREISKEIMNSKGSYQHNELTTNENNSRKSWNNINDLTKSNIKQNTSQINEPSAENFNEYFFQVSVNTYKQVTQNYPPNILILV